ncbi:BnaCnng67680D, partial [Brassica napus]
RRSAPGRRLWRTLLLQPSPVLLSRVLARNRSLPGCEFEDSRSLPDFPQFPKLQETQIYALGRLGKSAVSRVSVNSPRETGTVSWNSKLLLGSMPQISSSCRWRGQQIGSVPSSQSSRRPQINWDSTGEGLSVSVSPEKSRVGMTRRCCWLMWTGCMPQ